MFPRLWTQAAHLYKCMLVSQSRSHKLCREEMRSAVRKTPSDCCFPKDSAFLKSCDMPCDQNANESWDCWPTSQQDPNSPKDARNLYKLTVWVTSVSVLMLCVQDSSFSSPSLRWLCWPLSYPSEGGQGAFQWGLCLNHVYVSLPGSCVKWHIGLCVHF